LADDVVIIACSIFRFELENLKEQGKINVPVIYLNSMLHLYPDKLQPLLDEKIKEYTNFKIILLYGDCHARMIDYEKHPNILRSQGINCCDIFLGKTKYRELRKEGAFILLPEWVERWKEAFVDYMGFKNSKVSRIFMNEMHKKIVYIDTGFKPVPHAMLDEISDFFGLPVELYKSSLNELESVVSSMLSQYQH